ncbi:MAG TPA: hypothetical protein VHN15_01170 [Thermoanaerobaculia bacterium]|nr:hypothetical protein [Thermoanaerobaculia bacterium]
MKHIHPLQPIAVIVLIIVLVYFRKRQNAPAAGTGTAAAKSVQAPRAAVEKTVKVEEPPEVVFDKVRQKALATPRATLGLPGEGNENEPYGLVMEMGMADSVVLVSSYANGDATLCYQSGGGISGGGAHDNVRKAAREFVALSQKVLPRMAKVAALPLPGPGRVRFSALTPKGVFAAEVNREDLVETHALAPLFSGGQEVVAQMRQVQAERSR